jgi:hypothetical protein
MTRAHERLRPQSPGERRPEAQGRRDAELLSRRQECSTLWRSLEDEARPSAQASPVWRPVACSDPVAAPAGRSAVTRLPATAEEEVR